MFTLRKRNIFSSKILNSKLVETLLVKIIKYFVRQKMHLDSSVSNFTKIYREIPNLSQKNIFFKTYSLHGCIHKTNQLLVNHYQ